MGSTKKKPEGEVGKADGKGFKATENLQFL